jgi:hypothetical protein
LFHALVQIAAASRYATGFHAIRGSDHELHLFMPVKNLLVTLEA